MLTFRTAKIKPAPLHACLVVVMGCVSHRDPRCVLYPWCLWDTFVWQSALWKLKVHQGHDSQALPRAQLPSPPSGALSPWCDVGECPRYSLAGTQDVFQHGWQVVSVFAISLKFVQKPGADSLSSEQWRGGGSSFVFQHSTSGHVWGCFHLFSPVHKQCGILWLEKKANLDICVPNVYNSISIYLSLE